MEDFIEIYLMLKTPLKLTGISLAVGIEFHTEDIQLFVKAGIETVIWHDAFWFVGGSKVETYPNTAAAYFDLHQLFCAANINVPLWSIHPYKSHAPKCMWTDALYSKFCEDYWGDLEYVLPNDSVGDSDYYWNARDFRILFENMLPNAPCYNTLDAILESDIGRAFCIDYSHINVWTKNNREATIAQCLLATTKAKEIHLSSNKGRRDSHDYIEPDEWFVPYLDQIEKTHGGLYITYESLPVEYSQYGRLR
jgi:hypothetical protein